MSLTVFNLLIIIWSIFPFFSSVHQFEKCQFFLHYGQNHIAPICMKRKKFTFYETEFWAFNQKLLSFKVWNFTTFLPSRHLVLKIVWVFSYMVLSIADQSLSCKRTFRHRWTKILICLHLLWLLLWRQKCSNFAIVKKKQHKNFLKIAQSLIWINRTILYAANSSFGSSFFTIAQEKFEEDRTEVRLRLHFLFDGIHILIDKKNGNHLLSGMMSVSSGNIGNLLIGNRTWNAI